MLKNVFDSPFKGVRAVKGVSGFMGWRIQFFWGLSISSKPWILSKAECSGLIELPVPGYGIQRLERLCQSFWWCLHFFLSSPIFDLLNLVFLTFEPKMVENYSNLQSFICCLLKNECYFVCSSVFTIHRVTTSTIARNHLSSITHWYLMRRSAYWKLYRQICFS